jgi:DNA repair exonuclease SbcCD ATPase subunit
MKKLITLMFFALTTGIIYSQQDSTPTEEKWNENFQKAMEELQLQLENLEIAEIDMDELRAELKNIELPELEELREEVRKSMPSKEELKAYHEIARDALKELKHKDFVEIEATLRGMESAFRDLEFDWPHKPYREE